MKCSVIEVGPPRSRVVLYLCRFLGDGGRKPRVSVTEPGRPLTACYVAQQTRAPS